MVITGLTRNQFAGNRTWVRIPPSPPTNNRNFDTSCGYFLLWYNEKKAVINLISYSDITKLFSLNLKGEGCIEIAFTVKGHPKYHSCWMGKMPAKENKEKE